MNLALLDGVRSLVVAISVTLGSVSSVFAQARLGEISLGYGVDTAAVDVGPIVRTLVSYLRLASTNPGTSPIWKASEQRRPHYDLTARFVFQGFDATIVEVVPTDSSNREWVVKTFYGRADSTGKNIRPAALQRLYVTRRNGGAWELSSALPRLTRGWATTVVGPITYHLAPGWSFDSLKAEEAARFVDSLATALSLPVPRMGYYVTWSTEEMWRIIGLDYFVSPSGRNRGRGGHAFPRDGILISGYPEHGEAYLHELAHMVWGQTSPADSQNVLVAEGLPSWLGGCCGGLSYSRMLKRLVDYQRAMPSVRFEHIVRGRVSSGWRNEEADALYATAALIAHLVHDTFGVATLKRLLHVGPRNESIIPLLRELFGIRESELDAWWRIQVQRTLTDLPSQSRAG